MASEVEICNRALQKLGASPILALSDDTVEARECNRAYAILRDSELRAHPWSFTRTRAIVAASATAPAFEWATSYPVPVDFLRMGRLYASTATTGPYQLPYALEGRDLLTNTTGALNVIYYKRETDPTKFDALFVEALASKMAMELAEKLTQSSTKRKLSQAEYKAAIKEARRVQAIEKLAEEDAEDSWVGARR